MLYDETRVSFPVEFELCLELLLGDEGVLDGGPGLGVGLLAEEELAGAALLHDLGAREARELAEAVAAVHDRVRRRNLRVPQHEVGVWNGVGIWLGKDFFKEDHALCHILYSR